MLVLEGLEGHHRSILLELLWHQWLGIDLDYSVKWSWKQTKTILLFLRFHLSLHAVGPLSPLPPEDVLDPGIEPVSPALAGGFFTAEPPGKPFELLFFPYFAKGTPDTLNLTGCCEHPQGTKRRHG